MSKQTKSTLTNSTLTKSTLTNSTLTNSTLTNSTLTNSTLTNSTLTNQTLINPTEYYLYDFGVNYAKEKSYPTPTLNKILADSYADGLEAVVSISNSIGESVRNIKLSKLYNQSESESKQTQSIQPPTYPTFHYTLGCHPHNAKHFKKTDIDFIRENLSDPWCFAIGECGLDYNRMFSPKDDQIAAFEAQIILAKETNSKLYLHCRDAYDDFVSVLKKHDYYNGLVHCWTGPSDQALELSKLGFKLGITGWVYDNRRNRDLINTIRNIDIRSFLTETDAPFMPIYPAKISQPSDVAYIVEKIAEIKRLNIDECGEIIYKTSREFIKK